jgi:hypothetical protein
MNSARIVLGSLALSIGGCAVMYAIYSTRTENAAREAGAHALGFASHSEQVTAAARGAKTPAEWRVRLAEDAEAKRLADEAKAKAEAERQRQWEADAPRRAAEAEAARKRELAEWEERQPPDRRMSLSGQSRSKGGFDSVGLMSFTVKNDNPYPVKDFVVSCSFHGNSGTHLGDREHKVYETVKAKSSRAFPRSISASFQASRGGADALLFPPSAVE